MALDGTMRGGVIVFDGSPGLPEGARVRVELADDDFDDDDFGPPPPPTGETREEFLAGLREDYAAIQAGVWGKPLAEFAAELKREFGPPPPETYEEHLAKLRQSVADIRAGKGIPVDVAFAQIRADLGLSAEGE